MGRMTLSAYLEAQGMSYADFARAIGARSTETARRYATGERFPHRKMLERIAEATNGKVTANDFMGGIAA
jgi:transcriptional regulator with XRE-family HTH domain